MSRHFRMGTGLIATAALLGLVMGAGCSLNTMPTRDVWFTQHYPIMQDFERTAYRSLSDKGRADFQQLFWSFRTATAKDTFQARMVYVMQTYKRENSQQPWNTDRARVYLLNGTPASVDFDQNTGFNITNLPGEVNPATDRTKEDVDAVRAEVWLYPFEKYRVTYTFVFVKPSQWKMAATGDRHLGELEAFSKSVIFGVADEAKYKEALAGLEAKK